MQSVIQNTKMNDEFEGVELLNLEETDQVSGGLIVLGTAIAVTGGAQVFTALGVASALVGLGSKIKDVRDDRKDKRQRRRARRSRRRSRR
jgi:hypothetical protein